MGLSYWSGDVCGGLHVHVHVILLSPTFPLPIEQASTLGGCVPIFLFVCEIENDLDLRSEWL